MENLDGSERTGAPRRGHHHTLDGLGIHHALRATARPRKRCRTPKLLLHAIGRSISRIKLSAQLSGELRVILVILPSVLPKLRVLLVLFGGGPLLLLKFLKLIVLLLMTSEGVLAS